MRLYGLLIVGALSACATKEIQPDGMDKRQASIIQETVNAHLLQVRTCYETYLQKHTKAEARVVLSWSIREDLKVSDMTTKHEPADAGSLASCVADVFKVMEFPKDVLVGTKSVLVKSYPFKFSPGNPEQTRTYTHPKPTPPTDGAKTDANN